VTQLLRLDDFFVAAYSALGFRRDYGDEYSPAVF
jgi:hypothetical protein